MRLRPVSTLALRAALHGEARLNERERRSPRSIEGDDRAVQRVEDVRLSVLIHPYALIGHQVSNWISGYLWARDLGVEYEGGVLSRNDSGLFAFPRPASDAPKPKRLRFVDDETAATSLAALRSSLVAVSRRHRTGPLRVRLALDQPRHDHVPAAAAVRAAVLEGTSGSLLRALEAGDPYIAVHIRRSAYPGDISPTSDPERWLTSEWYVALVRRLQQIPALRALPIRVFALGGADEFRELGRLPNVELHLGGDRDADFVALAASRLLICAPSSFSFTAALASTRAAVVRSPWWHATPDAGRWTTMSAAGEFDPAAVERALESGALDPT